MRNRELSSTEFFENVHESVMPIRYHANAMGVVGRVNEPWVSWLIRE